jgi:hypothetical protein
MSPYALTSNSKLAIEVVALASMLLFSFLRSSIEKRFVGRSGLEPMPTNLFKIIKDFKDVIRIRMAIRTATPPDVRQQIRFAEIGLAVSYLSLVILLFVPSR